jgi:hypothetical protein
MKESKLIAEVIPAIPEYLELLSLLRDKYDIPLLGPDVEVLPGLLGLDFEPDIVRQEIYNYLLANPPFPDSLNKFLIELRKLPPDRTLKQFLIDTAEFIPDEVTIGETIQKFTYSTTDPLIETLTHSLFIRLITGQIEEVPIDWIGAVKSVSIFGSPFVLALAGPLTDINALIKHFRLKFYQTYGRKKKRLTNEKLDGAQYLRLQLEGYKARDCVDVFISLHQKEYDQIKDPKKQKDYKKRAYERISKQKQRLSDYLDQYQDSL